MVSQIERAEKKRRTRRSFTEEFTASAVRLVLDEGKGVPQVARDLDLTESALRLWVNQAQANRSRGKTGLTSAEREEHSQLACRRRHSGRFGGVYLCRVQRLVGHRPHARRLPAVRGAPPDGQVRTAASIFCAPSTVSSDSRTDQSCSTARAGATLITLP